MIVRGHRVYRGAQTGGGRAGRILLFLLVLLILLGLAAFSLLPQYLVYHRQSVAMVIPMLEESGEPYTIQPVAQPAPYPGGAASQMAIAAPDYSVVEMATVSGMNYLRAYYVPMSKVSETGLDTAVKDAQRNGLQGLVLQMKDETGMLAWISRVAVASGYSANGTWDPSAVLNALKEDGWFLAADISCAVDTLLATKNPDVALKDSSGAVYEDGRGSWVDLWNLTVRDYTADLIRDLLDMGFDEIILSHVEHPLASVGYTRAAASELSRHVFAMNFAIAVRNAVDADLRKSGAHLDASVTHDIFTANGTENGQDIDDFLRVFDRLVVSTGAYSSDVNAFIDRKIDSTLRFVPQMTWAFSGASVILDTAAPTE
jgi:hypothetical protein